MYSQSLQFDQIQCALTVSQIQCWCNFDRQVVMTSLNCDDFVRLQPDFPIQYTSIPNGPDMGPITLLEAIFACRLSHDNAPFVSLVCFCKEYLEKMHYLVDTGNVIESWREKKNCDRGRWEERRTQTKFVDKGTQKRETIVGVPTFLFRQIQIVEKAP